MKKTMKKIDKEDMRQVIQAIKQFSENTRDKEIKENISTISSKDILFYYLTQHQILETRVTRMETTQKMSMWGFGVALTLVSIGIGVFKL